MKKSKTAPKSARTRRATRAAEQIALAMVKASKRLSDVVCDIVEADPAQFELLLSQLKCPTMAERVELELRIKDALPCSDSRLLVEYADMSSLAISLHVEAGFLLGFSYAMRQALFGGEPGITIDGDGKAA